MTPPTGYRPCTADDLREGVEVLIPATLDGDTEVRVYRAGLIVHVWHQMLPGLALVRDDAAATPDDYVAALVARAEKAEADLLNLHADLAARDLMVAECDRLRRDLATATDAALRSALTTGSLSEAIRVAGVLCGIDAADPFAGLSALVERARGGR